MKPLPYIILLFLITVALASEPKPGIIEVEIDRGPEWPSYKAYYWQYHTTNGVLKTGFIRSTRKLGPIQAWGELE